MTRDGVLRFEVDSRVGSGHLAEPLQRAGCEVTVTTLEYADVALPPLPPISVGVELKKIKDLLDCIASGRLLGHQVPGLVNSYTAVYIVVEGIWRPAASGNGCIEVLYGDGWQERGWKYDAVIGFLTRLHAEFGITWLRTGSSDETVRLLIALAKFWSVPWEERTKAAAHTGVDVLGLSPQPGKTRFADKVARALPGIGARKAADVVRHFGSARAMACASPAEYEEVAGVGPELARRAALAWDGVE